MAIVGRKKTRSPFLGDRTEPGGGARRGDKFWSTKLLAQGLYLSPPTYLYWDRRQGRGQVPWARTSRADAPDVGADRTSHKVLGQVFDLSVL